MAKATKLGGFVAATTIAAATIAVASAEPIFSDDMINELKPSTWIANFENRFKQWTVDEVKSLMGTLPETSTAIPTANFDDLSEFIDIPDSFDATQKPEWQGCVHPIRDQMKCGSCWAFSASEVLSDRMCIASQGQINVVLSPQDLVSCDWTNMGCSGGRLSAAWSYLESTGISTDTCEPYTSGAGVSGTCLTKCADGSSFGAKYKAQKGKTRGLYTEKSIQLSLMTYGPVQTGFMVFNDFMAYSSGVYQHSWLKAPLPLGGHAVKIVGWGVEDGVKYWKVANSWGASWGDNGFFKIRRGINACLIEWQAIAGLADVSGH